MSSLLIKNARYLGDSVDLLVVDGKVQSLSASINAPADAEIVDATGTGDAYMSGFLYGYLNGRPTEECLRLGTALSAFVIQAVGCCTNIPMPEALEQKAAELL